MFQVNFKEGESVFKEEDEAFTFFVIHQGTAIVPQFLNLLKPGESFGIMALLQHSVRTTEVKAFVDCTFWCINRTQFLKALEQMTIRNFNWNRQFIDHIQFFDCLTDTQKQALSGVLLLQVFNQGQQIVIEGQPASSLYMITSGEVNVKQNGELKQKLRVGDSFGEQSLFYNCERCTTCTASTRQVECLVLGRQTLYNTLGTKIQIILFKQQHINALKNDELLSQLNGVQIAMISNYLDTRKRPAMYYVFKKGQLCKGIYVMIEGCLTKEDNEIIVQQGQVFGSQYLRSGKRNEQIKFDIVTGEPCIIAEIQHDLIEQLIGGTIEQVIDQNEQRHQKIKDSLNTENINKGNQLKLEKLIHVKLLTNTAFGSVRLVVKRDKADKLQKFVVKCIDTKMAKQLNIMNHFKNEYQVSQLACHPFIRKFYKRVQKGDFIYYVMEYIQGINLDKAIRQMGLLRTYPAKFYTASIILIVEYLHNKNIIHRDLKPDNIMVNHKGFCKLLDMGTCKVLTERPFRTKSIIGTPHYMAPEILTHKGYSFQVDLWAIGIILYEFMCGQVPFGEEVNDPYLIYEEIITKKIIFPKYMKDQNAQDLIQQLVNKVPENRLNGQQEKGQSAFYCLKYQTPWFKNFKWKMLEICALQTPFQPKNFMKDEQIKEIASKNIEFGTVMLR